MASTNSRPESESRPISAGSITRNVKKNSSEGLIVLSPEPGSVKFEAGTTPRPSSGSGQNESRAGSAGRVERKLLMARKSELAEDEPRRNSAGARISGGEHFMCSKGESCRGQQMSEQLHLKLKISHQKQPSNLVVSGDKVIINGKGTVDRSDDDDDDDDDSLSSSSDSDTDESEKEKLLQTEQEKIQASLELKGEFLQAVMDENYHKAQELCQKILLLEPDNATCQEFHAVIVEKKKQDEEAEEEESGEDSEESDNDDDDDEEEEEEEENEDEEGESGEDEEDEDTSEEEDDSESDSDDNLPPGSLNLIMGGLPIKPSSSQKTDHC